MMFKSKRIIISLFLMLAACGIMFAILFKTSDAVIAKINNTAITKKQFEAAKVSQNLVYDVHMQNIISSKTVYKDFKICCRNRIQRKQLLAQNNPRMSEKTFHKQT